MLNLGFFNCKMGYELLFAQCPEHHLVPVSTGVVSVKSLLAGMQHKDSESAEPGGLRGSHGSSTTRICRWGQGSVLTSSPVILIQTSWRIVNLNKNENKGFLFFFFNIGIKHLGGECKAKLRYRKTSLRLQVHYSICTLHQLCTIKYFL